MIQSPACTAEPRKPTTSRLATLRRNAFSSSAPLRAAVFAGLGATEPGDAGPDGDFGDEPPHPVSFGVVAAAVAARLAPARSCRRVSWVLIALNYPKSVILADLLPVGPAAPAGLARLRLLPRYTDHCGRRHARRA